MRKREVLGAVAGVSVLAAAWLIGIAALTGNTAPKPPARDDTAIARAEIERDVARAKREAPAGQVPGPLRNIAPAMDTARAAKLDVIRWEAPYGLATATIRVTTPKSGVPIRDLAIACTFHGRSGTQTDTLRKDILDVAYPGKPVTFRNITLGFVNGQATQMGCELVGASPL